MSATKEISRFCSLIEYESLPPEVIDKARYLALDFLGVAARGSLSKQAETVRRFLESGKYRGRGGVIIGTGHRVPHQYAALANGVASHTLELDDVHNESSAHIGAVVFPAALAAAEMARASERSFMAGVVAGYEIMARIGRALNPSRHYARGFHPTGTCGVFGAAGAAARIFGLSPARTASALGIAGSQAAGLMEFLTDGTWSKAMHPGWAAHSGVIAALLARTGFKGPTTIIEGKAGFLHAYSDAPNIEGLLAGLGKNYEITTVSIKPHACCRYEQGPIDGILAIMKENSLKPEAVENITIGMLKAGFAITVEPREKKLNPRNMIDAQLNMPLGAALAILFGKVSLDVYAREILKSPQVKAMMNRVICVADPELDKLYPKQWPASVVITTKDGQEFGTRVSYPRGDPENPLSQDELEAKFDDLSSPVFTEDVRNKIKNRVRALGNTLKSLAGLARLLSS